MTKAHWLVASLCVALIGIIMALPVRAADKAPTLCQTLEMETGLAAQYGWQPKAALAGQDASDFVSRFNNRPPRSRFQADSVHFFTHPERKQIGTVFILDGCVVYRVFIPPNAFEELVTGSAA